MKTTTLKSTVAGVAATAMLLTSGIVPTVTAAQAETVLVPGLADKINPKLPTSCASNPSLCNLKVPPLSPPEPAPEPEPAPGISPGAATAIGIVGGIIVGSALANAAKQKQATSATQAHYDWCFANYKTYRISDNSFMSYSGMRKPCNSPYI